MIVILDNIRSTHNVGAIFRTADAAGCEKIYLCGITPAPLDRWGNKNPRFVKTSLGAEDSVAWEKAAQTWRVITNLKKQGYTIFALEVAPKSIPYSAAKLPKSKKFALVLGSETKGLSTNILNRADAILEIPMHGKKESLNVSVAFGIVAFHLRSIQSKDWHRNLLV